MSERRPTFRQQIVECPVTVGPRGLDAAIRKCKGAYTIITSEVPGEFTVSGSDRLPPLSPGALSYEITGDRSVYILEAPPLAVVKIGFVESGFNIFDRIHALQTGCPYELLIVTIVPGSKYLEWLAHARFARERLEGEWFERSERIELFIAMLRGGKRLGAAVRDKFFD